MVTSYSLSAILDGTVKVKIAFDEFTEPFKLVTVPAAEVSRTVVARLNPATWTVPPGATVEGEKLQVIIYPGTVRLGSHGVGADWAVRPARLPTPKFDKNLTIA